MKITKRVMFCAAHSIRDAGKCANIHGHNWEATIEVTLMNGELTSNGFIADVAEIKEAAFKYDHGNLNDWFHPMDKEPSTENVAQEIAWDALDVVLRSNPGAVAMVVVDLIETENNSAQATASNMTKKNLVEGGLWTPES